MLEVLTNLLNQAWGYARDRARSYRAFIAFTLYLISLVDSVKMLIVLYIIMAIFDAAHESPKNVLIAESYPREEWKRGFAIL